MQTNSKQSETEKARWFSTGFLASGVGSVAAEQHTLKDAAVIRCGEARGHEMWVDPVMCEQVMTRGNELADKGVKARFGHPDMCSDALGTFLGRWKNFRAGDDGIVRGDLFLSATAAESPKGDLRNYVEQMAAKEPGHFGTSIVFTRDWEAEEDFALANGAEIIFGKNLCEGATPEGRCSSKEEIPEGADWYVDMTGFKSPDPANVKNFRHARLAELHAADLVDDPAATDGMFSGAGGAALAARTSEWLDTHPEVLAAFARDPEMLGILERYADQVRPFVERFTANRNTVSEAAEPATEDSAGSQAAAEPDAELTASAAELERVSGERDHLQTVNDSLADQITQLRAERDAITAERDALNTELAAVRQTLAETLSGQSAASSVSASEDGAKDFWARVRESSKTSK